MQPTSGWRNVSVNCKGLWDVIGIIIAFCDRWHLLQGLSIYRVVSIHGGRGGFLRCLIPKERQPGAKNCSMFYNKVFGYFG